MILLDYFVERLLINLLFFFFILFIFLVLWINRSRLIQYNNLLITGFSTLSIIFCMNFPVHVDNVGFFDLRKVPFIIGTLYGGYRTGIVLFIVLTCYRLSISITLAAYATIFTNFILLIVLVSMQNIFQKTIIQKKLAIVAGIGAFSILHTTVQTVILVTHDQMLFRFFCIMAFIQVLSCAMIIYLIENIKKASQYREHFINLEKWKMASEMAASVSHEVRNPLTVVRGFIQLAQTGKSSEEKRKGFLQVAISELDRASSILTDYMILSKPLNAALKENFNVIKVIYSVRQIIESMTLIQNIELFYPSNKEKDTFYIQGNERLFQQCILNICKNSIEAMAQGGKLIVSVDYNENEVTISIQDTGVGMTQEQIKRLGTPFISLKEKGTGLGMMVVNTIVKEMKGKINIISELGQGTTVKLIFPSSMKL